MNLPIAFSVNSSCTVVGREDLQTQQNNPANPEEARRRSQPLTPGFPRRKSGTDVHHMYIMLIKNVVLMRATMI